MTKRNTVKQDNRGRLKYHPIESIHTAVLLRTMTMLKGYTVKKTLLLFSLLASLAVLSGCFLDKGGDAAPSYSIGGTVTNLTGTGMVLRNNSGDDLSISSDGGFSFTGKLGDGAGYAVTVATQPTGVSCTVNNGSGTVAGANVSNVSVVCNTNPIGYYEGTAKIDFGPGSVLDLDNTATDKSKTLQAIIDTNTFALTNVFNKLVYIGTFTNISGTSYTANVRIYKNGTYLSDATLSGTMPSRSTMSGKFSGTGDYATGSFDMIYSDVNKRAPVAFGSSDDWRDHLPYSSSTMAILFSTATVFDFSLFTSFKPIQLIECNSKNNELISIQSEQTGRIWKLKTSPLVDCIPPSGSSKFDMFLSRFDLDSADDRFLLVFYDSKYSFSGNMQLNQ